MSRFVIPILIIIMAGVLSFYVTAGVINGSDNFLINNYLLGGTGKGIKELRQESSRLNEALGNAIELGNKARQLREDLNKLPQDKLERLNKFLPDEINNVDFLINLNGIAGRHSMALKGVKFSLPESKEEEAGAPVGAIGELGVSFAVSGSYENLLGFISDLADSLRVVDIKSLSFTADEKNLNQYNVELKTYWVK